MNPQTKPAGLSFQHWFLGAGGFLILLAITSQPRHLDVLISRERHEALGPFGDAAPWEDGAEEQWWAVALPSPGSPPILGINESTAFHFVWKVLKSSIRPKFSVLGACFTAVGLAVIDMQEIVCVN